MTFDFRQHEVTAALEDFMEEGFKRHNTAATGFQGRQKRVAFVAYDGERIAGAVLAAPFWGQMHVKNVLIDEAYRGRGLASELMRKVHEFAVQNGCQFSFLETLSFQARGLYEKLGYQTEFIREGFAHGVSFIYMKKDLTKEGVNHA